MWRHGIPYFKTTEAPLNGAEAHDEDNGKMSDILALSIRKATSVPVADLREKSKAMLDLLEQAGFDAPAGFIITRNGRPVGMLLPMYASDDTPEFYDIHNRPE